MKLLRLRGRKVCEKVLRQGLLWKGKNMHIRYIVGTPRHPAADPAVAAVYIGMLASTKLDKSAVKRNRMRRRCREAWRLLMQHAEKMPTVQLLISPRSTSLSAPFEDIQKDAELFTTYLRSHA